MTETETSSECWTAAEGLRTEPGLRREPDAWSEVLTLLVTGPVRAGSRPGPPAQRPSPLVSPCGVCPPGDHIQPPRVAGVAVGKLREEPQ